MTNDARLNRGPVLADLDQIEDIPQIRGGCDRILPPRLQLRGCYAHAMADTQDPHVTAADLGARLLPADQIGKALRQQRVVKPVLEVGALELARGYRHV